MTKKRGHNKVTFKTYTMEQPMLLPPSLEELIPEGHLVRVVNEAIERIDLEPLMRKYKGGGTSSYHPRMMLKVLIYGYTQKIFSSRKIAKALRENVNFMWISGGNKPDFRTINEFRGKVMKEVIEEVFGKVVEYLVEEGYVKLENYFIDGTKVEANARKYSYVWAKNTKRYKKQLQEKIRALLDEIDEVNEAENDEYGDKDLEELGDGGEIDSEKLKKKIDELNKRLSEKPEDKKLAKAVRTLERDYLPREEKYEEQEKILNGRNSYSKTDTDATFMRMKGEPFDRSQPKAAYNVQNGTEDQFVVGFSIHQNPGDSRCFIPHMSGLKATLGRLPKAVTADGAYGNEENYTYLEEEGLENYVKYNWFYKEQKAGFKKKIYRVENMEYDEEKDEFTCPHQQKITFKRTYQQRADSGYLITKHVYECKACSECPVKSECTKMKGNRRITISHKLRRYKEEASTNLLSERGKELRSQRPVDVETVFGNIKQNMGFRRFMLRGIEKVKTEWGLVCIAHNMKKLAAV